MTKANTHPAEISVIVAKNGHVLVFQGLNHQALFIQREHVPRYLENPQQAAMLVIPPFSATALAVYTGIDECTSISLTRDLALGDEFSLVIKPSRGPKIAYYSDHAASPGARTLAKQEIGIAITPMAVTALDQSGTSPSLSLVASIPQPQVPNYSTRFAADPNTIKVTVQDALYKINPTLRYAN